MRAAWYERQGPARDVLVVGEMDDPVPARGELRVRIAASGVNPGDVKKRADAFGFGMSYPRVVPHSDGAGTVDAVGEGVPGSWIGRRVWCHGAQSYRPHGTAAERCVVTLDRIAPLPDAVPFEVGATLGIPGITAHRAVHVAGAIAGRNVLVQGAAGAVGAWAVHLAHRAGARVIAVVRAARDEQLAWRAGAHAVVLAGEGLAPRVRAHASHGVDHIVEVAFGANVATDVEMLAPGGSIAAYASDAASPTIPFWPLVFANVHVCFLGSDDFPVDAKRAAADEITRAIDDGWHGPPIAQCLPLEEIARAHELVETPVKPGRIVVTL